MVKEVLDEREFELVNIVGAELGSNQRDLSRRMDLSLGMVNMLIRRLIAKGCIRIEQLNKRKVKYILTPKGFAEKMRKSVKYTLKTINSISLIKDRLKELLFSLYRNGTRNFYIIGKHDLSMLVEMVIKDIHWNDCSFKILDETPRDKVDGILLICNEHVNEEALVIHNYVHLIHELARDSHAIQVTGCGLSFEKNYKATCESDEGIEPVKKAG
ncbi:MAG: winged helix-turn-helix transcriptional regulator [Candidatus Omnitrophica bacterium]|nr:winged helix-turn-helix transcriptional regulator [Candidatus Omnitrophota bacterium]